MEDSILSALVGLVPFPFWIFDGILKILVCVCDILGRFWQ